MIWLALRMALHNRARLVVTLVGVVLSSYLVIVEVALYVGMMANATALLRHAGADLWIASRGIQNFDFPKLFAPGPVDAVLARADLTWARPVLLSWGFLKRPDGGQEQIQLIGVDPADGVGGPWAMEAGTPRDVAGGPRIILDSSTRPRLGPLRLASRWSLNDREVELVGISHAIKSFTTAPIVFAAYPTAQSLAVEAQGRDLTAFVAVKLRDPARAAAVAQDLQAALAENAVLTTADFVERTILYWTVQTGMGAALCLAALLALVVGAGVIGQTVFATTLEHRRELATLKAIGAEPAELSVLVLSQALGGALAGFGLALLLALASRPALEQTGVTLPLHPALIGALLALIVLASAAAALLSVRRVRQLDPASVFRA